MVVAGTADFTDRLRERLALFQCHQLADFVRLGARVGSGFANDLFAFVAGERAPFLECRLGGLHGRIEIGGGRARHGGDYAAVVRRFDFRESAVAGRASLALMSRSK